jgi:hypothetical protein
VGKAIYAIDAFPDDAQLWRIDWIGGVAYNASVPSEPLIDVCLARLPKGETNPLSARSRSSETKFVAKIGVGLLPFISTASVWQKGRPVATDCAAYRRQLTIDTKSCRTEIRSSLRFPTSRAMIASNPVQSTTTKRRFRQRMILPGANSTDSLLLMFRLLKK